MKDSIQKQSKRFTLRSWRLIPIIVAVVLVLMAGTIGLYLMLHRDAVGRRLKALRAAGYPTSMAEWAEGHKPAEGVKNAANVYEEAFSLLVYPPEEANVPILGQGRLPGSGTAWPQGMVKDVAACLASNRPCLDRLYKAAGIEYCWYNWEYLPTSPNMGELRGCGRLLDLEMLYHAQKGDVDGVVASFRAGLRLADSVRNEPTLLPYLGARMPCVRLLLSGLALALSATTFTDEQLQQLDKVLAQTAATAQWDFTTVIEGERCWVIEICRDPRLYGNNVGQGTILESSIVKENGLLDLLDYMADCIEATKLPPPQRLARLRAIDDRAQRLPFWHFVIKRSQSLCGRTAISDLRYLAHLDLTRTALAIERYRLATGKVPGHLEELVPRYLQQVLIDPFDSRPLRYKRTEPGYLLYSIMEDGQDNGGRQRNGIDDKAAYDLCFLVTR